MQGTQWRVQFWVALAILAMMVGLGAAPGRSVRAEDAGLDEPGTYLIEVSSGRPMRVGLDALVAWSPDSKTVAVSESGAGSPFSRVRLVQIADGASREVQLPEQGEVNTLRWSPDGAMLAFTLTRPGRDPGPALMVADPSTGAVRRIVRGSIGDLTWTPDSKGITAISLEEGGGSIVTFDADSGEVRETVLDARDASCKRGLTWSPDGSMLAWGGPGLREGCGDAGNWGIWTWQPAKKVTRQVFQGAADVPHWLGNTELVAMISAPETTPDLVPSLSLVRLSMDGSAPQPIAKDVPRMFPQPPQLVQVAANTVLYPVSTCDQGEAYIWSPGRPTSVRQTPEIVYAYRPWLSPDGKLLAYVQIGEPNQIVVAPLEPGEPRVLASTSSGLQVGTTGPWDVGGDWSPDGKWLAVEVTGEQFKDCVPERVPGEPPDPEPSPAPFEPDPVPEPSPVPVSPIM